MQTGTLNIFLLVSAGLNIVFLILTLRVMWKYTKEVEVIWRYTKDIEKILHAVSRQSEELTNQRRLSVLPAFAAWIKPDEGGSPVHRLYLKNVGNGMAMNVEVARIDFISLPDENLSTTEDLNIEEIDPYGVLKGQNGYSVFQPIQCISPNCEQVVKSFNYPADPDQVSEVIRRYGYTGFDYLSLIDEENPLHIDFQDIEGNKYHQVITRKGDIFVPSPVRMEDEAAIAASQSNFSELTRSNLM